MRGFLILFVMLAAISTSGQARAEKRIALVIGNGAYQNTAPLNNPCNDANDISAVLQRLLARAEELVERVENHSIVRYAQ